MMSSQLGRMILDASEASGDEMRVKPGTDGRQDLIGGILDEIALQALSAPADSDDRRPGSSSSTD